MNTCANFGCDGQSKRVRCGRCRHYKKMFCVCCDAEVKRDYKIYCDDCAILSRLRWCREFQREYKKKHLKLIQSNQRKNYARRKELNKSKYITNQEWQNSIKH